MCIRFRTNGRPSSVDINTLGLSVHITEQWSLNAQFKVVEIVRAPVAVAVVGVVCGVGIATGASMVTTNGLTSFYPKRSVVR